MKPRASIIIRLRRFARGERGTQLVELAITLPVLLMMFAAVAEFGRYFYTYATLAKATRAGSRYLSTVPVKTGGANAAEDMKAKQLVVYGDPNAASGTPLAPGLTTANVQITRAGGVASVPATVRVEIVGYNYTPLINLG
ncbi:MAG TPA: TadE/TadG family type IV pilus assembly protein, partial [Pyrinomonadaceae bacterium]|nr:TadE/TadG family type IV pilus assembly protein [Pyrinomonadaceae bacterium]